MAVYAPLIVKAGRVEQVAPPDLIGADLYQNTGRKNLLINGNFDIWQRFVNTERTMVGSGVYFTADRWSNGVIGTATIATVRKSFTLGQTDVPAEPEFYLQTRRDSASLSLTTNGLRQFIENVRTGAGQTVTLTFWARATAGLTVTSKFIQYFGTGGSPSADVTPTTQNNSITTSWQKFTYTVVLGSLSGKTIGTNLDSALILVLMLPLSGTYSVDFARIQVEISGIPTRPEYRSAAQELLLCQRYYYKTFRQQVVPAQASGDSRGCVCCIGGSATVNLAVHKHWPVTMRDPGGTIVITTYNPVSANNQWRDITNNADRTSANQFSCDNGVLLQHTGSAAADGSTNLIHVTAENEWVV